MISHVRGKILDGWDYGLVIDCGAMALELHMAHHQAIKVMEDNMDDPDRIITVPVVLDMSLQPNSVQLQLLGFATPGARDLYQALIKIPKIGRETAMRMLESGTHLDMLRAVAAKDQKWLMSFEGIGKAKADVIISELASTYGRSLPRPVPGGVHAWIEARSELMSTHDLTLEAAEDLLFGELSRSQ